MNSLDDYPEYQAWAKQVHAPEIDDTIETVYGLRLLLKTGAIVDILHAPHIMGTYKIIISVYDADMTCRYSWQEGNPIEPVDWLGLMVGRAHD